MTSTPSSSVGTPVTPITPADVSEYVSPEPKSARTTCLTESSPIALLGRPSATIQCVESSPSVINAKSPATEKRKDEAQDEASQDGAKEVQVESVEGGENSRGSWNTSPFLPASSGTDQVGTSELVTDDLDGGTDTVDPHASSSRDGLTGSGSPSSVLSVSGSSPGSSTLESPSNLASSVTD